MNLFKAIAKGLKQPRKAFKFSNVEVYFIFRILHLDK